MKKIIITTFLILSILKSNAQWTVANSLSGAGQIKSLAVRNNRIFAGTETGGIFLSDDLGNSWTPSNSGLTNMKEVISLAVNDSNIFAGIYDVSFSGPVIFFSSDSGSSWQATTLSFSIVYSLLARPSYLIAGTWFGVDYSVDNGTTFHNDLSGLPANASVEAMVFDGNKIFCGVASSSTGGTGVFYTIDNGAHWSPYSTGLGNQLPLSLAVAGTQLLAATNSGGIYRTSDLTSNWTQSNNGLTNTSINTLFTAGTNLFAGSDSGIFMSVDTGSHWSDISTGLPANTPVYSFTTDGSFLYAGSDSIIYRRPLSDLITLISENAYEKSFTLYPNPANDELTIVAPGVTDFSEITIYDRTGKIFCPENFLSSKRISETDKLKISLKDMTPGIYFINIKLKNSVVTKRFEISE